MNETRIDHLKTTTFLAIIFLSFQWEHAQGQDCKKLEDGKYKVKFKERDDIILLIDKDSFTQIADGRKVRGKIELNADCILRLDYLTQWDTLNNLQKMLSRSNQPYFKFEKTDGKRFRFRLTGYAGPHVTAGRGKFIRID